jgi:uncharacterized protein
MNRNLRILLITAISFAVYYILDELYFNELRKALNANIDQLGASHILTYIISAFPLIVGACLMHGIRGAIPSFGLDKSIAKGFVFSLICTLPMSIGYAFAFEFSTEMTLNKILMNIFAAAFFEEIFFRGFLFGQIYRFTKVGFIPSIFIGAFLFAFIHLYQSREISTLIGVFLITFLGAILFAWTYVEWNFNIWVPIFLHLFMNLFWMLFSVADNAFGGIYANVFRTISLILIVFLTISYKKRKGIALEVNRRTIWMKKDFSDLP